MLETFWDNGPTDVMVYGSIMGLFFMFFFDSVVSRVMRCRLKREVKRLTEEVEAITEWTKAFYEYMNKSK